MQVTASHQIESKPVEMADASKCHFKILVGESANAPNFVMREFTVEPGGHTPRHFHDYEHEVYVLSGSGQVLENDKWHNIHAGDVVFVAPNETHQFKNESDSELKFLCLIPNSALDKDVTVVPECGAG